MKRENKAKKTKRKDKNVDEASGISMAHIVDEEAVVPTTPAPAANEKKEFSQNLSQLKFMSRKKPEQDDASSSEVDTKLAAAQSSNQWQLPETTMESPSIYNPQINLSMPIVFRKGLMFAGDSDAVFELALSQSKHKKLRKESEQGGRISLQQQHSEDEDEVSSIDDKAVAKHFAKSLKRRRGGK